MFEPITDLLIEGKQKNMGGIMDRETKSIEIPFWKARAKDCHEEAKSR